MSGRVGYDTILVATDFSTVPDAGIDAALGIARLSGSKKLVIGHVVAPGESFPAARERLDALPIEEGRLEVVRELRAGPPAAELHRFSEQLGPNLLVVSTRGHTGLKKLALGSVADTLIRSVKCPVLIVGDARRTKGQFTSVVAAVDFSAISEAVFSHAVAMARNRGGLVRAVSAYETSVMTRPEGNILPQRTTLGDLAEIEQRHREDLMKLVAKIPHDGVRVSLEVSMKTVAADAIFRASEASGLIVVGTSGHNAWQRAFLGSTASRVVAEASCPVLVIPHDAGAGRS